MFNDRQELLATLYHRQKQHKEAVNEMQKAYHNTRICDGDGSERAERCKNKLAAYQGAA